MKLLDVLQSEEFDMICEDEALDDTTYTVEEIRDAFNGQAMLQSELFEVLSDEQKVKAESYIYAHYQYQRVVAMKEFRRGFKLAMKLMAESIA